MLNMWDIYVLVNKMLHIGLLIVVNKAGEWMYVDGCMCNVYLCVYVIMGCVCVLRGTFRKRNVRASSLSVFGGKQ